MQLEDGEVQKSKIQMLKQMNGIRIVSDTHQWLMHCENIYTTSLVGTAGTVNADYFHIG